MVKIMGFPFKPDKIFRQITSIFSRDESSEIDRELPFGVMVFTLMAASGITVYDSWKKLRHIDLLPSFKREAEDVVRQVEVLGYDPLTVMHKKAEQTKSKAYRDFLTGYVTSVKSGGSVVSFLKSKLRSVFEIQSATATGAIEKLGTLIEAYSVMLIVTLCIYILYTVISSSGLTQLMGQGVMLEASPHMIYLLIFVGMPATSILFIAAAHTARKSTLITLQKPYYQALLLSIGVVGFITALVFIPQLNIVVNLLSWPGVMTICLLAISLPPAISYHKIAKINFAAEEGMPSFLRDITEARKIGLSPEKSIIHATKREGYGKFSEILQGIRSQIEWGLPLKKIFENIKKRIQSWPALVHFMILVETMQVGGGSTGALEVLAEYSEKNKDIETNKRAMLRPYVVLAFIWSVLIALTTTVITMTLSMLAQIPVSGWNETMLQLMEQQMLLFSVGIIIQCWLSGFFIGKISEGTIAAGFKYSALLVVTAYISLLVSQNFFRGIFTIVS